MGGLIVSCSVSKINKAETFLFSIKNPNQPTARCRIITNSSCLLGVFQPITSVLPVKAFWQFGPLVDSKVGLSPPFHYAVYFKYVIVIQSDFLVVVIGWKVVNSGRMKIQWSTTLLP